MSEDADEIASNADGEINVDQLTNSGNSGLFSLSTGYPTKPVIEYLQDNEQLQYLLTNYADGVKINSNTTSLSDKNRNIMIVTDSRALIIIGDNKEDEIFEYKHKHIISSNHKTGLVTSDKLKFDLYDSKGNKVDVTFPVREGSSLKDTSQYIESKCKGIVPSAERSRNDRTGSSSKKNKRSTQSSSNYSSGERNENKNKQKEKKRDKIAKKIKDIESSLADINSNVINAEFQDAEKLSRDLDSRISKIEKQIDQSNISASEVRLQQIKQRHGKQLTKSHVLSQLRGMSPYEFETLVAKMWQKRGWEAEATSGSADRGVDVVAIKKDTFEKRRHLIQVKRHGENSSVGSEDIQKYASLYQRDEQVNKVFVVTSNRFTSEAKEVAKRRGVGTINSDELYEMLTET